LRQRNAREAAAKALRKIDPEAAAKAGVLTALPSGQRP
jgi:hypothetical protein